jgi:hypothetical protein
VVEDPSRQRVEDHQQADEDDHVGQHRRLLDRLQDDALDQQAAGEGDRDRQEEGGPVGPAGLISAQAMKVLKVAISPWAKLM